MNPAGLLLPPFTLHNSNLLLTILSMTLKNHVMKKEKQTIDELLTAFEAYLISLNRSRFTLQQYKSIWRLFKEYATGQLIEFYDRSVGDQFIKSQLGDYNYADLNQMQKRLVNTIDALYIFQQEGVLNMGPAPLKRKSPRKFNRRNRSCNGSFYQLQKASV